MNIEIGEVYGIWGKYEGEKRFSRLGNGRLVKQRIHAVMFDVTDEAKAAELGKYVEELKQEHPNAEWRVRPFF